MALPLNTFKKHPYSSIDFFSKVTWLFSRHKKHPFNTADKRSPSWFSSKTKSRHTTQTGLCTGLCLTLCFFLISLPSSMLAAAERQIPNEKDIFTAIQEKNKKMFGKSIRVRLSSTLVEVQLKNIPREMKELGKDPVLELVYRFGQPPRLELANVESFYADFFTPFEDILQRSGLFFAVDNFTTLEKFQQTYRIKKIVSQSNGGIKITIVEKDGLPGDSADFYYDQNWTLKKADFFEDKNPSANMVFFYKKIRNRTLPYRLKVDILDPENQVNLMLNLLDYRL